MAIEKNAVLTIRLPEKLLKKLKKIADDDSRPVANLTRKVLEDFVKSQK